MRQNVLPRAASVYAYQYFMMLHVNIPPFIRFNLLLSGFYPEINMLQGGGEASARRAERGWGSWGGAAKHFTSIGD